MLGKGPGDPGRHGVPRPRGRRGAEGEGGGPGQGGRRHQEPGLGRQGRSASGSTTGRRAWTAFDVDRGRRQRRRAPRRDHAAEGGDRGRRSWPWTSCSPRSSSTPGCPSATSASRPRSRRPAGLINVEEICAASPRLETIIFGPADFAASMEMPVLTGGVQIPDYPGDHFHYVFSKILMAGPGQRPAGHRRAVPVHPRPRRLPRLLQAHPHPRLRRQVGAAPRPGHDPERVSSARRRSSSTGRGTSSTPTEQATEDEGKGAVMFGDEMIDEASRKMALKFVSRGERAGLKRSSRRVDGALLSRARPPCSTPSCSTRAACWSCPTRPSHRSSRRYGGSADHAVAPPGPLRRHAGPGRRGRRATTGTSTTSRLRGDGRRARRASRRGRRRCSARRLVAATCGATR